VKQMDIRELTLGQRFALVLCPYSLVTYCLEDDDLRRLFAGVRTHLAPGGRFVVDAFVPARRRRRTRSSASTTGGRTVTPY